MNEGAHKGKVLSHYAALQGSRSKQDKTEQCSSTPHGGVTSGLVAQALTARRETESMFTEGQRALPLITECMHSRCSKGAFWQFLIQLYAIPTPSSSPTVHTHHHGEAGL